MKDHPMKDHPFWNPCARRQDFESYPRLSIQHASGPWITLDSGHTLLDGISSWWCKSLGHGHPRLKTALLKQTEQFEHVMGAQTTSALLESFCHSLLQHVPHCSHVLFASDGACSVEMALKMSVHLRQLEGKSHQHQFMALSSGYHGETLGALSVSDLGPFKQPYRRLLFPTPTLHQVPYTSWPLSDIHSSRGSPTHLDANEDHWQEKILPQLEACKDRLTAIIVEPLVQGASGMKMYRAGFLKQLAEFAKIHDIHLICDEIFTGVYRTGPFLASQHLDITPDFVCLSKGLTSGWLPLSVTLTTPDIARPFYDTPFEHNFLHSHTFSGNALAVAVAHEVLQLCRESPPNVSALEHAMKQAMLSLVEPCLALGVKLTHIRVLGGIAACEMHLASPWTHQDTLAFSHFAAQHHLLLRPINNTLYWTPPLNLDLNLVQHLQHGTYKAIELLAQSRQ